MTQSKLSKATDNTILSCLVIQISFVSISIAVSSIAFGVWLGLWIIQIAAGRRINYDKRLFAEIKYINIFILAYFFFEIFSRFFAIYPEGAFNNLKRLLLFAIFFVSIIKIIDLETIKKMLFINICAVSIISLIELVQYGMKFSELIGQMPFSEIRIGYFNYPLTAGEIKMISFFSVFPLLFVKEKFLIDKKYLILILVPVFVSMILTQSRNVFLAVFICFVIFGIAVNKKFLAAFIAAIILSAIFLPSSSLERFKSIADLSHPSNEDRINMWVTGWKIFKDHPLTGVADSHILEIYTTYKQIDRPGEGVHLHNNFIMILATTGIFGFLSFLLMFVSMFLKQLKFYRLAKDETIRMLLMGSILVMISFQVSGMFEWSFGDHEVMTVFFFLIAVPFILFKFIPENNFTNNK